MFQIEHSQEFLWQSQLRHRWDDDKKHCYANICDAQFLYSYEYLGNTPRLVITPLTDRFGFLYDYKVIRIRVARNDSEVKSQQLSMSV